MSLIIKMDVSSKTYYEELFNAHYNTLCNYAYNILSDIQVAEDIVQNYFVYVWEKQNLPIPDDAFLPYSLKTIRNSCINHYKSEITRKKFYDNLLEDWRSTIEDEEDYIYTEQVQAALNKLPEKCKAVFLLKFVSGMKYKEIAEISNISINTVKYHISEAYRIVKMELIDINIIYLLFFLI